MISLENLFKQKAVPGMVVVSDVDGVHTSPGGGVKITARSSDTFGTLFTLHDGTETLELISTDKKLCNQEYSVGGFAGEDIMEFYQFHTPDGQGILHLLRKKIKVIIVSGRNAAPVRNRFENKLGAETHLGISDKLEHFVSIGLDFRKMIFVGDGHQDVPLLGAVRLAGGIAIAPADAEPEAARAAECVTDAKGGEGVFSEIACAYIDFLKQLK